MIGTEVVRKVGPWIQMTLVVPRDMTDLVGAYRKELRGRSFLRESSINSAEIVFATCRCLIECGDEQYCWSLLQS